MVMVKPNTETGKFPFERYIIILTESLEVVSPLLQSPDAVNQSSQQFRAMQLVLVLHWPSHVPFDWYRRLRKLDSSSLVGV